MNIAMLGGNLTDEPELRYTGAGTAVANATIATNERYKNNEGELVEDVVFHDCVIWGNQAEVIAEYADKGQYIVARGVIQTNEWEDQNGMTRRDKEVKVLEFDFGPRNKSSDSTPSPSDRKTADTSSAGGSQEDDQFEPDDDLPF